MNCRKAQKFISNHIDYHLNETQQSQLAQHLEMCRNCRKLLADMEGIVEKAKHLETVSLRTELWPTIRMSAIGGSRLQALQTRLLNIFRFHKAYAFAFGTIVVAFILAGLFYYNRAYIQNGLSKNGEIDHQAYVIPHLAEMEQHYKTAIAQLSDPADDMRRNLDPTLEKVFQENLEIMDASIRECRAAVERQPGNVDAQLYLVSSLRGKIELLNERRRISMQLG